MAGHDRYYSFLLAAEACKILPRSNLPPLKATELDKAIKDLDASVKAINGLLDEESAYETLQKGELKTVRYYSKFDNNAPNLEKMVRFTNSELQRLLNWMACEAHKNRLANMDLSNMRGAFRQLETEALQRAGNDKDKLGAGIFSQFSSTVVSTGAEPQQPGRITDTDLLHPASRTSTKRPAAAMSSPYVTPRKKLRTPPSPANPGSAQGHLRQSQLPLMDSGHMPQLFTRVYEPSYNGGSNRITDMGENTAAQFGGSHEPGRNQMAPSHSGQQPQRQAQQHTSSPVPFDRSTYNSFLIDHHTPAGSATHSYPNMSQDRAPGKPEHGPGAKGPGPLHESMAGSQTRPGESNGRAVVEPYTAFSGHTEHPTHSPGAKGYSSPYTPATDKQAQPIPRIGVPVMEPYPAFAEQANRHHVEHPVKPCLATIIHGPFSRQQQAAIDFNPRALEIAQQLAADLREQKNPGWGYGQHAGGQSPRPGGQQGNPQMGPRPMGSPYTGRQGTRYAAVQGANGSTNSISGPAVPQTRNYPANYQSTSRPPPVQKSQGQIQYDREMAQWRAEKAKKEELDRLEQERKAKLKAEIDDELREHGNDVLFYRYREYLEVYPVTGTERRCPYKLGLLANQVVEDNDMTEHAIAVRYAKEKWYNYWELKDKDYVIELMNKNKKTTWPVKDAQKSGGYLITAPDLEALRRTNRTYATPNGGVGNGNEVDE